jgi:hypothetical protein
MATTAVCRKTHSACVGEGLFRDEPPWGLGHRGIRAPAAVFPGFPRYRGSSAQTLIGGYVLA